MNALLEPAELAMLSAPLCDENGRPFARAACFGTAPLSLVRMLQFGDSALPVGGFAFSGGLEAAVQERIVHDVDTLRDFTLTALEQAARGDAVALAWSMRTLAGARERGVNGRREALVRLTDIDHHIFCRKLAEEARNMSVLTGKKLAELALVTGLPLMSQWLRHILDGKTPGTCPTSLALLFSGLGLNLEHVLVVHQQNVAMMILNAALRLMRVTHLETQAILFGLGPAMDAQCRLAASLPLDRMSSYMPMTDILGAIHVKAHVRLFMS